MFDGFRTRDIQTSGINLNARYDYDQRQQRQVFRGYQAMNRVSVKLRDIDETGEVLEIGKGRIIRDDVTAFFKSSTVSSAPAAGAAPAARISAARAGSRQCRVMPEWRAPGRTR